MWWFQAFSLKIHYGLLWEIDLMQCEDTEIQICIHEINSLNASCNLREISVWFTEAAGNYTIQGCNLGTVCEGEIKRCTWVVGFVSHQQAQRRKRVVMLNRGIYYWSNLYNFMPIHAPFIGIFFRAAAMDKQETVYFLSFE